MKRRWVLAAVLVLVWVFAVVAFYYVVHKPFTFAHLRAAGQALAGLGGALLVVALGIGIGVRLLRGMLMAATDRLVWAAAVGLGVVSLAGLGLGAVGLLRPWLLWPLAVLGLLATGGPLWRALAAAWQDPAWRPRGRFERFLAIYCGVTLVFALLWAMTPPSAWDSLDYHLTGPKLYLETGRVSHPFDLPHLGFPQLVEMLFAWGMGLVGERAAAPIHWCYGALAVLALVLIGRRWLDGAAGWSAAAVLLSARSIVMLAGEPYVDLALLLYTTLSFWALSHFLWSGPQQRWWLALSGVSAGLALSVKYTALALLPALVLASLASRIRDLKSMIRNQVLLIAVALATWLPWLIKNLALTGNPIYPFFFDGLYWDDYRAAWYDRAGTGLAYTDPWRLLIAPWDATVWGIEGASVEGVPGYVATIGPLFLALLPLLLLVYWRLSTAKRRWLRAALAFCGVLYGFWLWGVARSALLVQTRLLFPAFGLLALLVGVAVEGLQALPQRPVNLWWLARAVVVSVLVLALAGQGLFVVQERPLGVLLGFEDRERFLTRRLGWYYVAVRDINQELPPDAVVLFLWEERAYHCHVVCWPDSILDRWPHTTYLYGHDVEAIADAWRVQGVTHVLLGRAGYKEIVKAGFDPITDEDVAALDRLVTEKLDLVEDVGGVYELYALEGP